MNLEKFDSEFSILLSLFKREGFHAHDPTEFEKRLYAKLLSYNLDVGIITSRLEEEITNFEKLKKAIFHTLQDKKEPNKPVLENFVMTQEMIRLDLSDFYVYTRMFLDALTRGIKHSFKYVGNKNWNKMKNTVTCLLNKDKMETYKKEIDSKFFEGLERKVEWIHDFKKSRDNLIHHFSLFVFSTTKNNKLGYDLVDAKKPSWGSDTVKAVDEELQNMIDNLSDLLKYLSKNLPRM